MEIISYYHQQDILRSSFNALAEETFGLNFENWYRMGYWGENYTPYSILEDGQIVANVSVNRTDLVIGGERKRMYQLGTVMTKPEYRNRGYIRRIMGTLEETLSDADGIYLFANDEVLEFYPKFGFRKGQEHEYFRRVQQTGPCRMEQVPMDKAENRARLEAAIASGEAVNVCAMVDNTGLIFFYAAQFLCENVYYCRELDVWAIAEQEEGALLLHAVFGNAPLNAVIEAFGQDVQQVTLGFVPGDKSGWECRELREEDSTFFVKGPVFESFAEKKLRIPSLSHA